MKHKKSEKPKKHSKPEKNDLDKLRQQIDNLQKEKDELFGKLQRVSADYANFQKRVPKQIADTICYEKEKIAKTKQRGPKMSTFSLRASRLSTTKCSIS